MAADPPDPEPAARERLLARALARLQHARALIEQAGRLEPQLAPWVHSRLEALAATEVALQRWRLTLEAPPEPPSKRCN